jgi:very-short-patch-repair endonuclease
MRNQIKKLTKGKSTKNERRFMEFLKELHIPFRTKVIIGGREVDFVIGHYAIEIDGHQQDSKKNVMLLNNKYWPVHLNNCHINDKLFIVDWLKKICHTTR